MLFRSLLIVISGLISNIPIPNSLPNLSTQLGSWCGWVNTYIPLDTFSICVGIVAVFAVSVGIIKIIIALL